MSLAPLLTFTFGDSAVYEERPRGCHHSCDGVSFLRRVRLCLLLVVKLCSVVDVLIPMTLL